MKNLILTVKFLIVFLFFDFSGNLNAQWVQVSNGMGSKIVYSLAQNGNYIFAGTVHFGVYKSTNNGSNWSQTVLNNRTVNALAVNGNNIFAGTTESGVYISTNSGMSWTQTSLNNRAIFSLATNGNNIFAGTFEFGVYVSYNNGITWTQTSLNNLHIYSLATRGNNVFAGTLSHGVYLSTNNGTSWAQTPLNNTTVNSMSVNSNYVLAGTLGNGIYLSTNDGTIWIQTSLNYHNIWALIVSGNNIFAGIAEEDIFLASNDNGANWYVRNEGLSSGVEDLCIVNSYLFAGTGSSVYRRPLGELIGIQPISNEIPDQFSLSQNYPNPFNPSTKIKFAIPSIGVTRQLVLLKIYDVLGREIKTLINEQLSPGTYEIEWNASNSPSGVYFYKLEVSDPSTGSGRGFSETKRMVLIK